MKVYNPYSDSFESLLCHFELHYNDKQKLVGASVKEIESKEEVNIVDYLKAEKLEEIEQEFLNDQPEYFEG